MSKRIKRSHIIIILPMSALILLTSGCQTNQKARIYSSTKECIQEKFYTQEYCQTQFQQANRWHQNNAPKFDRREKCEDTYGINNCQNSSVGGTLHYIPYMRGYSVGKNFNQPIYGSTKDGFRSVTGKNLGNKTGVSIPTSKLSNTSTSSGVTKTSPKGSVTRGNYGRGTSRGG